MAKEGVPEKVEKLVEAITEDVGSLPVRILIRPGQSDYTMLQAFRTFDDTEPEIFACPPYVPDT